MSKSAKHNLDKLLHNCDEVCELASLEAIRVIGKIKTLNGRRLDHMAKALEKTRVNSVIGLETLLLTNRKFARELIEG